MWTKPYGKTGKDITAVSFGGMRFENPKDIDGMAEIVLHAYNRGINYFDTAPGYCGDKSEDIMGAAFRQMDRGRFYCSTKCSNPDGDELRKSLERSLQRLGVEKIDFFHIWCILTLEAWEGRKKGGAVEAALKARDEGLIEHVVVSSHLPGGDLKQLLEEGYFEGVTLGYCAINFPYRQQAVDACQEMNLGVVTMNPLGGGIIPNNPEKLAFLKGEQDRSVVEAAIRFNVSQPAVTSALVGFSNTDHVDQAVDAVEEFQPYAPEHTQRIREKVFEKFEGLCTGCGYCLPCPSGVPVPKFMDVYNQKILDDAEQMKGRMKWHWGIKPEQAAACSLCGQCEDRCTQHLPITERLKEIAAMADESQEG